MGPNLARFVSVYLPAVHGQSNTAVHGQSNTAVNGQSHATVNGQSAMVS